MNPDDFDKAVYDCITSLWKAYRESVGVNDYKPLGESVKSLYARHKDKDLRRFIEVASMVFSWMAHRRLEEWR